MNWINFEKQKPVEKGYYLCAVWGFSQNQYGTFKEYHVLFFDGENFGGYPISEHYRNELVEFRKVIYYCEIQDTPYDKDVYRYNDLEVL